MNENAYIASNALERVPVVPLLPVWPPVWAGGELANEAVATVAAPPESLTAPCPTCLSAIGWRLPDGTIRCGECCDAVDFPDDAVKVVFVDDGRGWVDYTDERRRHERRHERRHDAPDEPDELPTWEDGIAWNASTPKCPKCGSAALWESLADRLYCLNCNPPHRAQRIAAKAALIRSRPQRRVFTTAERESELQESISD